MKELLFLAGIAGIFSIEMRERIRQEQGYCCADCGKQGRTQVHHIIPQRLGGADIRDNGVALCESCHSKWDELSFEGTVWPGIPIEEAPKELYDRKKLLQKS